MRLWPYVFIITFAYSCSAIAKKDDDDDNNHFVGKRIVTKNGVIRHIF